MAALLRPSNVAVLAHTAHLVSRGAAVIGVADVAPLVVLRSLLYF